MRTSGAPGDGVSCVLHCGNESLQQRISLASGGKNRLSVRGHLVVLARRTPLSIGDGLLFPSRGDEVVALQTPHRRIDGAAGEAGGLHDAESVDEAGIDSVQDERSGVREFWLGSHGRHSTLCSKLLDSCGAQRIY